MDDSRPTVDAEETLVAGTRGRRGEESHRLAAGDFVGRYTINAEIGSGAMGVVYRAHDPELDREIALKIVNRLASPSAKARAEFFNEARTLAKLSSPNVVAVFDVGSHGDGVFIAMEHIEGSTLDEWLAASQRERSRILDLFVQAGHGLADAHAAGIVHGDFKPSNVMVDSAGRARVLDFGLARPAQDPTESRAGQPPELRPRGGTPAYMAPELFAGESGDARADQFGFCIALWEALVGERPFPGRTVPAIATSIAVGRIRPIPASARIPGWLQRAMRRGLRAPPEERWPSMDALLHELTRVRRGWRHAALGTALFAATGAAFYVGARRMENAECVASVDRRMGFWDEQRETAAREAILAIELPYAPRVAEQVSERASDYVQRWRRASIQVCSADDDAGDPRLQAAARSCLEDRRARFDALATLFTQVEPDDLPRVNHSLDGLPSIEDCTNPVKLERSLRGEPSDPGVARQVAAIRVELARVWALGELGRYAEAGELAQECVTEADATDFLPLRYEAELALGAQLVDLDRLAPALEHLRRAYEIAVETDSPKAQMDAALSLAFHAAVAGDVTAGRHWIFVAGARASHPAVEDWTRGRFHLIAAEIDHGDRQIESALAHQRRAQELFRRSAGEDSVRYATLSLRLGLLLRKVGQSDEALALIDHATAVLREAYGDDHPHVADAYNSRALTLMGMGQLDEAVGDLERALGIWQRTLSADHPSVAYALVNLCRARADVGDYEGALKFCDDALSVRERHLGADHLHVAYTRTDRGDLLRRLGRLDEALADAQLCVENIGRQLGPDHPNGADALTLLGRTLLDLDRPREAIPVLRRALDARESTGYEHIEGEHASTRAALALALAATGDDPAQALQLAREASRVLGATDKLPNSPLAEDEAQLRSWLAGLPTP